MDEINGAIFRKTVVNFLEKMNHREIYRPAKTNLTTEEWKAIRTLQKDPTIMIIPADKGNKTIVLDKDLYISKLEARTQGHIPLQLNPAPQYEKDLNDLLLNLAVAPSRVKEKDSFIIRRSELKKFTTLGAPAPWNHGLMKLHKDGLPLRDISDASQSPGHDLAKALNKLFTGYTGQTKHHLQSHNDLIDILKTNRFQGGFFVSFDAVELYPSIIIEDAL